MHESRLHSNQHSAVNMNNRVGGKLQYHGTSAICILRFTADTTIAVDHLLYLVRGVLHPTIRGAVVSLPHIS